MPTYEYRCKQCKHEMEEFQSMKDEPLTECPECHTPNLVRLISAGTGLIFKGKGFYLTDYKNGSSPAAASGSSKPKDDGAKSEGATGDGARSEGATGDGAASEGPKGGAPKTDAPKAGSTGGENSGGSGSSASNTPAQS